MSQTESLKMQRETSHVNYELSAGFCFASADSGKYRMSVDVLFNVNSVHGQKQQQKTEEQKHLISREPNFRKSETWFRKPGRNRFSETSSATDSTFPSAA